MSKMIYERQRYLIGLSLLSFNQSLAFMHVETWAHETGLIHIQTRFRYDCSQLITYFVTLPTDLLSRIQLLRKCMVYSTLSKRFASKVHS